MRWFFNMIEGQVAFLNANGEIIDPDTNQVFKDLSVQNMSESDDWFEYDNDPRDFAINTLRTVGVRPIYV